jgi:hypothetical protein
MVGRAETFRRADLNPLPSRFAPLSDFEMLGAVGVSAKAGAAAIVTEVAKSVIGSATAVIFAVNASSSSWASKTVRVFLVGNIR